MKYFTLDTVLKSFTNNVDSTSNKFWGVLAIISALNKEVLPCTSYTFEVKNVSNLLERLFCLKDDKKKYSQPTEWGVIFSNKWTDYVSSELLNKTPNIYDVIGWYFRNVGLNDDVDNKELIKLFLESTHLSVSVAKKIFDFSERELNYADHLYKENELANKIRAYYAITPSSSTTVNFDKNFVVASAGELARAPFVQALYAGQGVQECLILTQFNFDEMYTTKVKTNHIMGTHPLQQIYYGAPGTGKSYEIDLLTQGESVVRTTFHPDSDYSTFVGAYKPTMQEVPVMTTIGTQYVSVKDSQGNPVTERRIEYNYIPQAFLQAYVKAWKLYAENPSNPKKQFLVIEEINRGNCAQIFGDLFQLLDRNEEGFSSYDVFADADIKKYIASQKLNIAEMYDASGEVRIEDKINSGELLSLPCNLYIWATMNTSDQSLFPIDSAFKRRWDWKYMPINPKKKSWFIEVNGTNYSWTDFLEKINEEIGTTTSSEDKKLGFFFCKADGNKISADRFVSKVLFYIYNDVFKDYGFNKEFFKGEKGTLTFQTFYNLDGSINESNVEKLLTNLGVSEAILEDDDDQEEDLSVGTEDAAKHDYSKFSINGEGTYRKRTLVAEVARKYADEHPEMSVDEVYAAWKGLGLKRPSRFLQTQADYEDFIATSNDPQKERRQTAITCGDEQKFYVSTQWNLNSIKAFIDAVNAQDWGIKIQKLP